MMSSGWLLDGFVILFYFVVILGIGLYMGRREESLHDFALGGRRIPWWAVLASIIAAETSAGTFIGTPGEGFTKLNFTYLQLAFGTVLARVVIAALFIRPYYDYNVYSIYEFLTVRFGTRSKNAASGVFLVTRVLASGTRLYVSAIILVLAYELWTGARPDAAGQLAIYVGAIVFVVVLTAIYTTLGGIKAVIWTDVIQATIMMGSAFAAIVILYRSIPGGWTGLQTTLGGIEDNVKVISTGLDPARTLWENIKGVLGADYTIFAGLLGATFLTMGTHGTDQDMVQRMLTAKDIKRSRLSLVLSGLADLPIVIAFLTIGILLWAFYQTHPDPNLPKKTNEIFCYYILHELPAGMRGLLVAGIFATAMGSLSAALNALATSYTRDWHLPFFSKGRRTPQMAADGTSDAGNHLPGDPAEDQSSLRVVRWATVVFSVLMIVVAAATAYFVILYPDTRIIPIALGVFGYTYGSLLGVFLLGVLTRTRGNDTGNLLAMVVGFLFVALLSGLPNDMAKIVGGKDFVLYAQPGWLPYIAFPWRIMFGTLATLAVGLCFRTPAGKVRGPASK